MAHYAIINSENIVENIIYGIDEDNTEDLPEGFSDWESFISSKNENKTVIRTSYNTFENEHSDGKTPLRGNYAQIGGTYNEELDVFLPQKPFDSWILNETNYSWKAPIDKPNNTDNFGWVEENYQEDNTTGWELIPEPE